MKAYKVIELTPERLAEILRWHHDSPPEWRERVINQEKIRIYIKQHLERVEEKSRHSYRMCYEQGSDVYRRRDGGLITQDILDCLQDADVGQENRVYGKVGDAEVTHSWAIDSSD
jgi:hypothetical protein